MGSARLEAAPDRDAVTLRLWTALQAVSDPDTYASTGQDHRPAARAALVKRAKAMIGLFLFEIEGLIRAFNRYREKGICHTPSVVHAAWLRWLQLHGRQARVVVKMDGWLVGSFPRSLLTTDHTVLDVLAASPQLADTAQASSDIRLPIDLFVPAELFGSLILHEHELATQVAALFSSENLAAQSPTGRQALPSGVSAVAGKLIDDFVAILVAGDSVDRDYPGH